MKFYATVVSLGDCSASLQSIQQNQLNQILYVLEMPDKNSVIIIYQTSPSN